MSDERSKSGAPVFRHEASAPAEIAAGDPELVAAVDAHITRHFGPVHDVFHEIVSPYVHIDLHIVMPSEQRPVITVVTSGMSERPMRSESGDRYAELMLVLPPTWPTPGDPDFESPSGYWPYRMLKALARLPHEFDTFLWRGHTVPNGDPPQPYGPNTRLAGAMIVPMLIAPDEAKTIRYGDREISLFAVWPLHADEMQLKLDQGLDPFIDLADEAKLTELVEADRPSFAPRRRRGLFRR